MKTSKAYKKILSLVSHPLMSGSFVMIGGSMGINIVNYVYHLLMGRILGPVAYGTLASVFALLYIITVIPTSTSNSIVKFISGAKSDKEILTIYFAVKRLIFSLAIVTSLIVLVFSPIIASFLNIKQVILIILVAPTMFFSLITLVNQATLQGKLDFVGVVGPNFISSIIKFVLGILLVLIGWSVLGAMWAIVIGAILAYIFSEYLIKRKLKGKIQNKFDYRPLLKYSVPVFLLAVSYSSFFTTDLILVKHFFSAFDAGIYASLSTLGKVIYFAAQPITGVMFPIVSGRSSRGEKYRNVLVASLGLTVVISFGIVLGYFIFSKQVIEILYGASYLDARSNLVWMGFFIAFYSISFLISNYYISIGRVKVAYLSLLFAFLQIILIWIWHSSLFVVILISLSLMIFNFLILVTHLLYNFGSE